MTEVQKRVMSSIEWAVREISEALGAAYEDPKDRLKVLLEIQQALVPTGEGPVGWAFREEAFRLGAQHNLCHQCARDLVAIGDETFCPVCDVLLLEARRAQRKEAC